MIQSNKNLKIVFSYISSLCHKSLISSLYDNHNLYHAPAFDSAPYSTDAQVRMKSKVCDAFLYSRGMGLIA